MINETKHMCTVSDYTCEAMATNTLLGAKEHVQAIAKYFRFPPIQVRLQVLLDKEEN